MKAVGNEAEVALPGTNWIAIVKSGGNDFHGRYSFSGEQSAIQSNNIDDELRAQGVTQGNPLRHFTDLRRRSRRPLIRDKLWFYGALRDQRRQNEVIGYVQGPGADGQYGTADDQPGFQDLILTNQTIKGTFQASRNNKLIGFYQRNLKDEPQSTASRFVPFEARTTTTSRRARPRANGRGRRKTAARQSARRPAMVRRQPLPAGRRRT